MPLFEQRTQISLQTTSLSPSDQAMKVDISDPSPAYTPISAVHRSLDDDTSTISNAPSVSASLGLTQEHIKAHLRLLRAFQVLKWRVQDPDSYPEVASRIPPRARSLKADDRWVWFLQLAVERCDYLPRHLHSDLCVNTSCAQVHSLGRQVGHGKIRAPPNRRLDGLAFLHAQPSVRVAHIVNKYLNRTHFFSLLSRWYAEDCERLRLLQPLKSLRGHPIDILVSRVLRP